MPAQRPRWSVLLGMVTRREGGLRTGRRISHVFVMDVPAHERTLFITDAAVNIAPDLMAKRDIVQNAIDFAPALDWRGRKSPSSPPSKPSIPTYPRP